MKETPQRLRSLAPPTRDKIFIWSAVIAGCGIIALLGRHAAITRFGTDEFTGNVLFAVFLILTIGLYFGFQSVIESLFNRLQSLFRRREVITIAETAGEQISISTPEEPEPSIMECSAPAQDLETDICPENTFPVDSNEEIEEDVEYLTLEDGTTIKIGAIDIDDVVFDNLEDNITEYGSLQERDEACGEYPYFEDYIGGYGLEDVLESDTLYNEWVSLQPKHIKKELELGIYRVRAHPKSDDSIGCFTKTAKENRIKQDDGKIRIEEWEEDAYIDANGDVYYSDQIEAALKALKADKEHSEIQKQLLMQHEQCNAAHAELAEEDMKFSLAQIEFICAYITFMMQPYLKADELQKLHHNAKIWTVNAMPPFIPVNLRSNHLTKEDLKHLGYNVGKFLRLQGGVIARFVKKVFEKPFENTTSAQLSRNYEKRSPTRSVFPSTPTTRWTSFSSTSSVTATSTLTFSIEHNLESEIGNPGCYLTTKYSCCAGSKPMKGTISIVRLTTRWAQTITCSA